MPTDLVIDLVIRYGFQVFGAIVILAVGALAAHTLGGILDRELQRQSMDIPMRRLFVRAARIVVFLFTFVVALDKFGFQVAPLVAGIGVAGIGVGLAMQGVLSNVVAGLTIIFTKPFRVGEYIEVLGVHGDVIAVDLFSTTLMHPDRSRVVIPNRKIVGEILHNFGTTRQITLNMTVPRGADLARVLAIARDVVVANPRVLKDPAPAIGIANVRDGGIQIGIQPWVKVTDAGTADTELYHALLERFEAVGIATPVSYHEVKLLDGAARGPVTSPA